MAKKVTPRQFNELLQKKTNEVIKNKIPNAIKLCCEQVRSTMLDDMEKTPVNSDVSYYNYNKSVPHHPSLPGNPPAPDSGNLRKSIHYTVEGSGKDTVGRVGTDVKYGKYLEFGTSRIAPRPWIKPSLDKNKTFIISKLKEALKYD